MGKEEIMKVFEKNPGVFLDVRNISVMSNTNEDNVYAIMRRMEKDKDIQHKKVKSKQGPAKKLYAFIQQDNYFEESLHQLTAMKQQDRFHFYQPELLVNVMILSELKKLNEGMLNGNTG